MVKKRKKKITYMETNAYLCGRQSITWNEKQDLR